MLPPKTEVLYFGWPRLCLCEFFFYYKFGGLKLFFGNLFVCHFFQKIWGLYKMFHLAWPTVPCNV